MIHNPRYGDLARQSAVQIELSDRVRDDRFHKQPNPLLSRNRLTLRIARRVRPARALSEQRLVRRRACPSGHIQSADHPSW